KRLVTIVTDCDLTPAVEGYPKLEALKKHDVDKQAFKDFLQQYGFRKRVKDLEQELLKGEVKSTQSLTGDLFAEQEDVGTEEAPQITSAREVVYENILTWEAFDACFAALKKTELVAMDTETTSLEPMVAKLVGISFSIAPYSGWYIPLTHDYTGVADQLLLEQVLEKLKPWLEDEKAKKVGQNIKYDWHVFANHGIDVKGYAHDTMLQSYVLEAHRPHGLESLAERHLGRHGTSYTDLCGKGVQQIPFSQLDIERAGHYAAEDSDMTLAVHQKLWPEIEKTAHADMQNGLAYIYELEMKTSGVLARMECQGVLIDVKELGQQSHQLGRRIAQIEQEAYEIAGEKFNLGSPKQIGEILFDKLGLPVVKKTAKGASSTNEEVLEKLALDYPLPAKILEHRSLSKLKNTYTDKLPQMVNGVTGRVHTNYAQSVAVTGRLASNDPNLQNIPIRTEEGRRVRKAFIAPAGCKIASADYSQIELRIMAHLSGDAGLLGAFEQGLDVHRATASEVFGVKPDEVSSEQRRYAKVINFGLIYGMSAYGLASNLGIENAAAKMWIDRYFQRYPGVRRYMDETKQKAKELGYIETVFGRKLYLPEINSPNGPRRSGAERAAINAPMQGTAADLIKLAMIAMEKHLQAEKKQTRMIMQVHDELVLEVPEHELDWVKLEVPKVMASVAQLKVPLIAEI
ncbi:MAG: DNA polymerase I, partial [Saezia sp.]